MSLRMNIDTKEWESKNLRRSEESESINAVNVLKKSREKKTEWFELWPHRILIHQALTSYGVIQLRKKKEEKKKHFNNH